MSEPSTVIRNLTSTPSISREDLFAMSYSHNIHVDDPAKLHNLAIIGDGAVLTGNVSIGPNSVIFYNTYVQADSAPITIGEGCCIVDGVVMHNHIELGDFVHIAHSCLIHRRKTHGTLRIGSGTLVGFGSQVHADIGMGCQIAPGTIVDREIPDFHFVGQRHLANGEQKSVIAPMKPKNYQRVVGMYRNFWARRIIINRRLVPLKWHSFDRSGYQCSFEQAIKKLTFYFNPDFKFSA